MEPYMSPSLQSNPSLSTASLPPDLEAPSDSNFKVYVRTRPLTAKELSTEGSSKKRLNIIKKHENIVFIMDPDSDLDHDPITSISKKDRSYTFSDVFDSNYSNESVYANLMPIPPKLISGINCTIFAYGMTGAGKSHTMFGLPDSDPGLNFRLLDDLINTMKKSNSISSYNLKVSYLEIYNEQIRDLLVPNSPNLLIFEDPIRGFLVSDLSEYDVCDSQDLRKYITQGNQRRTMATTGANQFSSRSHAILQVFIEITKDNNPNNRFQSKLNLIDLAGSERAAATDNRGLRMKESANINRSLMTLGLCINILSDTNKKGVFVPYRDSKLTKLLKDSLGGNTMTFMIACVSPFGGAYEETINTLKYASKAKNITKKVTRNIVEVEMNVAQYKKIVEDLKKEIKDLRKELEVKTKDNNKGSINTLSNIGGLTLDERQRERLFEEIGESIFQNLQENWEVQQSVNELNELQSQNEERLRSLLEINGGNKEGLEHEIKGLKLIMENNEKVKRGLEFSLMTNQAEKKSLQEYLRNFNKEERGLDKDGGDSSQKMREMEMEMEMMRRKLAEKDLLIEKNNKLLEILKRNHERSSNFSPQFYPLPHHMGSKGSLSFFPNNKKTISGFTEPKTNLINPIKIPESKFFIDQNNTKLSDRSHKKNPLIPQRFLNDNAMINQITNHNNITTNDTSIMRGYGCEEEKKEENSMSMNPRTSISTINQSLTPQHPHIHVLQANNNNNISHSQNINNNSTLLCLNKSTNSESPTKYSHQKINISLDNQLKLIPSKRDSPIKPTKKISSIETSANNTNTITSSGNSNNNGLIINVILKGNNEQAIVRKKSNKDIVLDYNNNQNTNTESSSKNKESIKLNINKGSSSTTNKYFKKMAVNVSYDNISQQKKSEIPLMKANLTNKQMVFSKNLPNSAFINLKTPNNLNNNNNNNGVNGISKEISNINKTTGNSSTSNKNNKFNNNILSTTSMLKKDTRISVNIKNLDRARDNYKNFKEKLGKMQQNISQETLNDSMKKSIQGLLTDYAQNQYMLSATDQNFVKKLKDLINFNSNINNNTNNNNATYTKNPRIENMIYEKGLEEKTRSNSVIVFDTRGQNKEESKKNEEEILLLLNNKKFGRLSNDRINSAHHKSSMMYNERGLWFDSFVQTKTTQQDSIVDPNMNPGIEEDEGGSKGSGEFYEN